MQWVIDRFDSIDSTNRYLLDLPATKALPGRVAVANFQTAGRGRLDRSWEAHPGDGLLFSVLLPVACAPIANRAMALAISDCCPFATGLKWPNDVLVREKKLAGILAETTSAGGKLERVVAGCGLNLRAAPTPEATCFNDWAAIPANSDELLESILKALDQWCEKPAAVAGSFANRCVTLGRQVRVLLPAGQVTGEAVDIGADGSLIVDVGGEHRSFAIGDVEHVR